MPHRLAAMMGGMYPFAAGATPYFAGAAPYFAGADPQLASMLAMAGAAVEVQPAAMQLQNLAQLAPAPAAAMVPLGNPAHPAAHPAHPYHALHLASQQAMRQAPPAGAWGGVSPFPYGPNSYIPPELEPQGPQRFEHSPLPFPRTIVAASATVPIVVRPQVRAYRVSGLLIPSSVGPNFDVNSILVGTDLVFAGAAGPVPALVFSELAAQKVGVVTRSAPTALDITLNVTNTDAVNPHTIEGTYFGDAYR